MMMAKTDTAAPGFSGYLGQGMLWYQLVVCAPSADDAIRLMADHLGGRDVRIFAMQQLVTGWAVTIFVIDGYKPDVDGLLNAWMSEHTTLQSHLAWWNSSLQRAA